MKMLMHDYEKLKSAIQDRLMDFKQVWASSDERIFEELIFCVCTPQSNAKFCFEAVNDLTISRILFTGDETAIGNLLRGRVRFHNNKSRYIMAARLKFSDRSGKIQIKKKLPNGDPIILRDWLVKHVKGLGYKEASHFLRNIGMGDGIAILDRHILRNMVRFNIIKTVPDTLTGQTYLDLEKKLYRFSNKISVPLAELDLLLWARETGEIFK